MAERKVIEVTTLGETKRIMSGFAMVQIMLALQNGNTVTVVDEHINTEYLFRPAVIKECNTT